MNDESMLTKAERLRRAFDRSFTRAPAPDTGETEKILALRAGELRLALRASDIVAIRRCPRIVPVAAGAQSLLGMAALDGRLLAIHSLAAVAGSAGDQGSLRWVAVCSGSLALAFDELEGFVSVSRDDDRLAAGSGALVDIAGVRRELVDVSGYVQALANPTSFSAEHKE